MNKKLIFLLITVLMLTVLSGCGLFSKVKKMEEGGQQQPGQSAPAKDSLLAKHIPTLVLVKTNDQTELAKIVERFDGEVLNTIEKIDVHQLKLGQMVNNSLLETMDLIKKEFKVDYVEPVYVYQTNLALTDNGYDLQWGPQAIGLENALAIAPNQGAGVTIAVLDTGVDYNHPEFANRILPGYNVFDDVVGLEATMDYVGHGTHVAGIAAANINSGTIAGIAPQSTILPVKVLDEYGGSDYSVAAGIIWAADNGAQVINMSLGGKGYSQALQDAVNYAVAKNVVILVAMGNSGTSEVEYPAACSGVIAVGAANAHNEVADFSTRGRHISVSAPGASIYSSIPGAEYGLMSGTSMATPHVTGAVALLLSQYPNLTPAEVKTRLESSAIDLGPQGFDEATGHGMINLYNLLTDSSQNHYGAVEIYVTAFGSGLAGVDVLLVDPVTNRTVANLRADQEGYATFHNLTAGTYEVTVSMGADVKKSTVTITPGMTAYLSVSLVESEVTPTTLAGYVVHSRAGAGVANSNITLQNLMTGTTYTCVTGADGYFSQELPAGTYEIRASKIGYAASRYQNVEVSADQVTTVSMVQPLVNDTSYLTEAPTIQVTGVANGAVVSGIFEINVTVDSANAFDELQMRVGQMSLAPDAMTTTNMGTLTVDTTTLADGESYINLMAFDVNNNRTEWTIPIEVQNGVVTGVGPDPVPYLEVTALTFGQSLEIMRAERASLFAQLGKNEDPNIIEIKPKGDRVGKQIDISSAPADATMYIELEWGSSYNATGYKVYRATSEVGPYVQIADVYSSVYRDTSSVLTVGQRYYYKVVAYNESGDSEASDIVWTAPLDTYNVYLESPMNGVTNLTTGPTFTWSEAFIPPADVNSYWIENYIYVTDLYDGSRIWDQYAYDTSVTYNGTPLVAGRMYEWDVYDAYLYVGYGDYTNSGSAIALSGESGNSLNGPFTFEMDPSYVAPVFVDILTQYIDQADWMTDYIPVEITTAGEYQFMTEYYTFDCDTVLTLYDSTYQEIGFDDDGNEDFYSRLNIFLEPGIYYVQVHEYSPESPLNCILKVGYWE